MSRTAVQSSIAPDSGAHSLADNTVVMLKSILPYTGTSVLSLVGGDAGRYRRYLSVLHAIMRASVPLMTAAAPVFASQNKVDVVQYLSRHIEEETDHDRWLVADLEAGGLSLDAGAALLPEIAQAVGAQYYHIFHGCAEVMFGYILCLEALAPSQPFIDGLAAALPTLPPEAFRTLQEHHDLDGGHTHDLCRLIDDLPFSVEARTALQRNALETIELLHRAMARFIT